MKKTIADINHDFYNFNHETNKRQTEFKEAFFEAYRHDFDVQSFLRSVNKDDTNEYSIDEGGWLVAHFPLPYLFHKEANYPFLIGFLESAAEEIGLQYSDKHDRIENNMGPCITVQTIGGKLSAYDYGDHTHIVESLPQDVNKICPEYLQAKIESYMRAKGEFGAVVVTDSDGDFLRFFDCKLSQATDEELEAIITKTEGEMNEE